MVQEAIANEPLQVEDVSLTDTARESLLQCWSNLPQTLLQLVPCFDHLETLVKQVSDNQFDSVHTRA
jgi:hypothetical protein